MYNPSDPDCKGSSGWRCCLPRLAYWLLPLLALGSLFSHTPAINRMFFPLPFSGHLGYYVESESWLYDGQTDRNTSPIYRRITDEQRLILYGDSNAETAVARQKAILERRDWTIP